MSQSLKIKIPADIKRSRSGSDTPQTEPPALLRKKRRLLRSEEDLPTGAAGEPNYCMHVNLWNDTAPETGSQNLEAPSKRGEAEIEVDLTVVEDGDGLGDEAASPYSVSSSPPPFSELKKRTGQDSSLLSRRNSKKKYNQVHSDDDDEDVEYSTVPQPKEEKDDDFEPSPPQTSRKAERKHTISGRPKMKGTSNKGGGILTKDDPRANLTTSILMKVGPSTSASSKAPGMNRLKEMQYGEDLDQLEGTSDRQAAAADHAPTSEEAPAVTKKKKLPTIKKNRPPQAASGTSTLVTPAQTSIPTAKVGVPSSCVAPTRDMLPLARKPAATAGNTDIDLTNADIYNSLFKSAGGMTPHSGLNRREKDEERRKELDNMRDQAKAERVAKLDRTSFDFLAAQEKVSRFESKLKERNSAALYPHYLAACLKHKKL